MKRITTLLFCVLLACMNAQAQRKVKLKVLERGTEQPVIAATVVYADNEALQNLQGSVTNVDGLAELKIPSKKTYYYKISYVGFVPATGKIETTETEKTVYLEEDHLGLNEVVVTGSRTARPIKMSPVTTQVLGGKQLVEAGYSNLQQALQQETPGLNIQKVGFGNEISMQGLDARHVLFLMDGERMTGDMAGNLDYERFNLHAIDRIEIVKGASSTLYGSRAAGAVINLITKKTTKPLSIDAGVRYGQMNERNYKNPQPKDFLYMFEKNADRPNLQGWVSAGFKAGKVTSQTDAWYSSSDAFYMYQAENDKKVYTQEANPFLPHDITVVNSSSRPPMGIEGKEHITVSQKLYYDPTDDLLVLVYGSTFFMNTYDLIQDMTFSQARDWTAGAKLTYHVKDWFSVTGSLHADFYDRFKRQQGLREQHLAATPDHHEQLLRRTQPDLRCGTYVGRTDLRPFLRQCQPRSENPRLERNGVFLAGRVDHQPQVDGVCRTAYQLLEGVRFHGDAQDCRQVFAQRTVEYPRQLFDGIPFSEYQGTLLQLGPFGHVHDPRKREHATGKEQLFLAGSRVQQRPPVPVRYGLRQLFP